MRREGYELSVGKPQVVFRDIDGKTARAVRIAGRRNADDRTGPVMELVGDTAASWSR